jgi:hypothetical protein
MTYITIAAFNIEKNGQSSDPFKQQKVSEFVDYCCKRGTDLIFLCEVHAARIQDYMEFLKKVYSEHYLCESLDGGHSNAYVVMHKKSVGFSLSYDQLNHLNRNFLLCTIDNKLGVGFAHFKSGQTGLTKNQIESAAEFLNSMLGDTWAIAGDMNWDMSNFNKLKLPAGSHCASCWPDMTQKSGGILDWCLAGKGVILTAANGYTEFHHDFQTMDGPDHRPVLFQLAF